jgi:hypothetical protein
MTNKASKLAIAISVLSPLAVAVATQSSVASVPFAAAAIKAKAPASRTDVQYRKKNARQQYWSYDPYYNGAYWRGIQGVAPYESGGHDPYLGSYWDGVAPY